MGTVVDDTPVLDDDGSFRGHDGVVITDAAGELNALVLVEGTTLFQVIHVSDDGAGSASLGSFIGTLTLDS